MSASSIRSSRCLPIPTPERSSRSACEGRLCRKAQAWRCGRGHRLSDRGHDGDHGGQRCASTLHFGNISSLPTCLCAGPRCRRPAAHSAHRAGHRRDERQPADRQERQGDRHRQRRQYRKRRQEVTANEERRSTTRPRLESRPSPRRPHPQRGDDQFRPAHRSARRLCTGGAAHGIAADWSYWDQAAKRFINYFDSATSFVALADERYGVSGAKQEEVGSGTLKPRKRGATSFDLEASCLTCWSRDMSTGSSPTARAACRSRSTSRDRARRVPRRASLTRRKPRVRSRPARADGLGDGRQDDAESTSTCSA